MKMHKNKICGPKWGPARGGPQRRKPNFFFELFNFWGDFQWFLIFGSIFTYVGQNYWPDSHEIIHLMHFPCILHAFFIIFQCFYTFLAWTRNCGAPQGPEGGPESTISNSCKKCVKINENAWKTWKMHEKWCTSIIFSAYGISCYLRRELEFHRITFKNHRLSVRK